MNDVQRDKKVNVDLHVPLTTVGNHPGGQYNPHTGTTTFTGSVKVDPAIAEDLERRQKEYEQYERSLIRDGGRPVDLGTIVGNQGA